MKKDLEISKAANSGMALRNYNCFTDRSVGVED